MVLLKLVEIELHLNHYVHSVILSSKQVTGKLVYHLEHFSSPDILFHVITHDLL